MNYIIKYYYYYNNNQPFSLLTLFNLKLHININSISK